MIVNRPLGVMALLVLPSEVNHFPLPEETGRVFTTRPEPSMRNNRCRLRLIFHVRIISLAGRLRLPRKGLRGIASSGFVRQQSGGRVGPRFLILTDLADRSIERRWTQERYYRQARDIACPKENHVRNASV